MTIHSEVTGLHDLQYGRRRHQGCREMAYSVSCEHQGMVFLIHVQKEDEETVLHLLGECSALVVKRANILGSPYLYYEELGKMHWCALLRLAKASRRF